MEKLNRQEVKSISKQANAITVKSPIIRSDGLIYSGIALIVIVLFYTIIYESARKNFAALSIFLIMGIVMIVVSKCVRINIPKITMVFYNGKMIFHTQKGVYYSITPSELISYDVNYFPTLFESESKKLFGLLNLNCEFGSFGSLYVFKTHRLKYYLDAFKEEKDVLELAPYTPTFWEGVYKYLVAMFLSFAFMFGFGLCFRTPYPLNIVVLIAFPLIGLVSFIYFLAKILKIRKQHKNK